MLSGTVQTRWRLICICNLCSLVRLFKMRNIWFWHSYSTHGNRHWISIRWEKEKNKIFGIRNSSPKEKIDRKTEWKDRKKELANGIERIETEARR